MDKAYWNNIGAGYNEEIFDAYQQDRNGLLRATLEKYSNKDHLALDVGCGTGKAFPYLSPLFGSLHAVDISPELLKIARQSPYQNITYQRADLSRPASLPLSDFAFCCNVIILPEIKKNIGIIKNIQKALKVSGAAVFVMPSVESILFAGRRMVEWYQRERVPFNKIPKPELAYYSGGLYNILHGLIRISGVTTKHYLQPEIELIFDEAGLAIQTIQKLEYDWTTEFAEPPSWMGKPYPWDWMVEVKKINK